MRDRIDGDRPAGFCEEACGGNAARGILVPIHAGLAADNSKRRGEMVSQRNILVVMDRDWRSEDVERIFGDCTAVT